MADEEQHHGSRRRARRLTRWSTLVVPVCVLLGTAPALPALSGPALSAGAATPGAALQLAVATYAGDAVSSTTSGAVLAGTDVTYRVSVTNSGSSGQTNVSVPVVLSAPFALHPASVSASQGTASPTAGRLTWSVGTLAGGATATLDYTETVDAPSATESDSTTASATSDQSTTTASASSSLGIVPASDLTVAVTDGVDAVSAGSTDTYTVMVTNNGPSAVTNATVTDTFSSDVGALGASSSLAGAAFTDLGGGQGDWTGVTLASGATATFLVGATLPPTLGPGSTLVNLATVAGAPGQVDTAAPSGAVDSDIVSGGIGAGALALSIASSDGSTESVPPSESVLAGHDVTYQVVVTNHSASPLHALSVPVTLPAAFTLHPGVTSSAGSTTNGAGTLGWAIPSLAVGASATLEYTETADAPASFEADVTRASASVGTTTAATAAQTVEVIPAAALSVSVDDGTATTAPGSSRTYTVSVTNTGPAPADGATVSEAFNGDFTALVGVSSIGGTSFTASGNVFTWTGVNLAVGASATLTLMGDVGTHVPAGGAFVDVATAAPSASEIALGTGSDAADADTVLASPQAITFSGPAGGVVGQSVILSAVGGGSGNPVVFSVPPSSAAVCATSGTNGATLKFTGAGTCVVDADQAGNASFAAAPTVTRSVVVDQTPSFSADSPPTTASAGQPYAYTFAAGGSPAPTLGLAPGAPPWLTLDPATGALSGTPPAGTSSFAYSLMAANRAGSTGAGPFNVTVAQAADPGPPVLAVALSCPGAVAVGGQGICTLGVHNEGSGTAASLRAAVVLPFGLRLLSAPAGFQWFSNARAWSAGSLAPGASETFSITFRAVAPGRATVVAGALSAGSDPTTAHDFTTATVLVSGQDPERPTGGLPNSSAGRHHRDRR